MEPLAVIMGAGPAGLTACYELGKESHRAVCLERDEIVGGISRTDEYKGYRFDIGGHRFFTKCREVDELWTEILGPEMLDRPRLSRIFYNGHFFDYPLKPASALKGLGVGTSIMCLASYFRWKVLPYRQEENFEQWVTNRFGKQLFEIFFKTYTEKVWGMPCTEISADWAAQRIKGLSLWGAVKNALFSKPGDTSIKTLIDQFRYPRLGPGMMWEKAAELSEESGQQVILDQKACEIHHEDGRIRRVTATSKSGETTEYEGTDFISSLPLLETRCARRRGR
jgi:protoporphyrinogen oxidase